MYKPKSPFVGFRLSWSDLIVLVSAALGSWALYRQGFPFWWIIACVVGHFFLFCNVFRIRRSYELFWAMCFLINVGSWMQQGSLEWWPCLPLQVPFTLAVILAEIRSPRYHGVFAQRLNAHLDVHLASHLSSHDLTSPT